jgi:hypothetical protein
MKNRVERVIGIQITDNEFDQLRAGWKAFCEAPESYAGSVVAQMVRQDIDEIRR